MTVNVNAKINANFFLKVSIDLTGAPEYNGFKVIYLLGMAFAFPTNAQKEVYGCGCRNQKRSKCGGQGCTIR